MSTFVDTPVTCPHCRSVTERTIATSINGPRIPEVVGDIRDGTFQVFTCPACHQEHEVDEPMAFIDFDQRRWVTMYPAVWEASWRGWEAEAERNYRDTMIVYAAAVVAELREGLWRRTVFGLDALREKLAIAEHGLDDVAIEALKLDLMRGMPELAVTPRARPRFVEADAEALRFRAVRDGVEGDLERPGGVSVLVVERGRYDAVLEDAWGDARAQLGAGSYVDIGRILFDGGDADALAELLAEARVAAVGDPLR
ncbi:MAG: CpXC domain-containing protein [Deltaproteobacteria bacterium]|nr:CpXC domain-containing protein [Deltaproteobacteria bacterium]